MNNSLDQLNLYELILAQNKLALLNQYVTLLNQYTDTTQSGVQGVQFV